ncbi:MAG: cytochrome c biogenesis protein CcsA, partial [Chlorobi bacterium]|nr:cytochrome c biogenesis protein CcsA [Chlorobiota bacterium]
MKKIYNILVSTTTMAILFVIFAASMAIATFIESRYGTETARTLVYDAWWFELLMTLGLINLIGNIIRYRLYRKENWHSFIFHLAFIFILIGAAVTRYIGYEGQVPIIEGDTARHVLSEKTYIKFRIDNGREQKQIYRRFRYNALGDNRFRLQTDFRGQPVELELLQFIPRYKETFIQNPADPLHLTLVESSTGKRRTFYLPEGRYLNLAGMSVGFNTPGQTDIAILGDEQSLHIQSRIPGNYQVMQTGETGTVPADTIVPMHTGALYTFGNLRFVVPESPRHGHPAMMEGKDGSNPWNYLEFKVTANGQTDTIGVTGGQYYTGAPQIFSLGGLNFVLGYGPKRIPLGFGIHLRDFQIDYYPGSRSPKSYASEITVIDRDTVFPYRIYMNHVLDYKGYRFFQSSYNVTPQYEQTFLSANHDFWGTWITYIGYAMLYFGLLMIFVNPHSLYNRISRHLAYIQRKKKEMGLILLLAFTFQAQAQHGADTLVPQLDITNPQNIGRILRPTIAPDSIAEKFGHLVIQDYGGRMKPVNTYASELFRKLSKHDTYKLPGTQDKINADQGLLSMTVAPEIWSYAPLIYLERGDDRVRGILGLDKKTKYARLVDFFDEQGNYKLAPYVEQASKKRIKSKFDKDVENIDKRVNLLYATLMQTNLRLFPLPGDPNNRWYAPREAGKAGFHGNDSLFTVKIIPMLAQAVADKDYTLQSKIIDGIDQFQRRFGAAVYPPAKRIKWEIYYNKHDAFRSMFWQLMLASIVLLFLAIARIIRDNRLFKWLSWLTNAVIFYFFLKMVFFLGLRWYISGHAPWSNAYESMIYIALATLMFGLWYGRKSQLTLASTAFVSSMMLMIAHWNWMDPAIENLVPVLDSYWLMIHVAVIVASYGPFTLSAMLALLTMLFIIFTTNRNKPKFELIIKELTDINKMSLIVGIVLLTIGTFLGGQWANESWGRYWSWDPKETWSLISIMLYALVIHSHMIPWLRGLFRFNTLSLWTFASILMTYFGVNFYLAGLHSYAKGEPVKTPEWIYTTVVVLLIINL